MSAPRRWRLKGAGEHGYSGAEARLLLRNRLDHGTLETWFEDPAGARSVGVFTNGARAMVMLLRDDDPGEHLVDPGGDGRSEGFVLANGQVDTYDDRDTVPFDLACRAVDHLIEHGGWPDGVTVADDRGQ